MLYEEERGLCPNCIQILREEKINTLEEMVKEHKETKERLEWGIKQADKKIAFFRGLITSLTNMDSTK